MGLMHLACNPHLSADEFTVLSQQMLETREAAMADLMAHYHAIPAKMQQQLGDVFSSEELRLKTMECQQQYLSLCFPLLHLFF